MDNSLIISYNNICKSIKNQFSSSNCIKDVMDTFKEWIPGNRKWEKISSINDILQLLIRADLFGIYRTNSIDAFKKLVNDSEFDNLDVLI